MEAFSLLKYWRGGGGNGAGGSNVSLARDGGALVRTSASSTTTIVTAVNNHMSETDEEDNNDDGPFFDLEFSLPQGEDERAKNLPEEEEDEDDDEEEEDCDSDDERELKFTLSSGSSGDSTDRNVSLSPSDDLFFKGRLVPVEPNSSETNSKSQFPVSLLKSATKFRVMMLKFKKSKSNVSESPDSNGSVSSNSKEEQKQEQNGKSFTVKFKVEEVPIVSLFMRENSSKSANNRASQKQNLDESVSDEKRFSKDAMQRYLKKVKPLYVRVSKRYGEKLKFSGQLSLSGAAPSTVEEKSSPASKSDKETTAASKSEKETTPACTADAPQPSIVKVPKQGSLPAGLRVVYKHLGKSRSASAAVAAAPPGAVSSKRRDDSLLQQQDGIQSAILHCKRSFKASRDLDSSILARSASDTSSYVNDPSSSSGEAKEACK